MLDPTAALARARRLALLVDLDGTLIPFAATAADAVLDDAGTQILREIIASGVHVTIVSGRPQALVDPLRARVPGASWFAEHGAWCCDADGWRCLASPSADLARLESRLTSVVSSFANAHLERKTAALVIHWRSVDVDERDELREALDAAIDPWLDGHSDHERLSGVEMLEIRRRGHDKSSAVAWVRERFGKLPIIAIGDDVTDEDMFRALEEGDLPIIVGRHARPSSARARVDDVTGARRFLRWLQQARGAQGPVPPAPLSWIHNQPPRTRLLVISNRTPAVAKGPRREVGGLVAALEPAMRDHDGIWLGWSGEEREQAPERAPELAIDRTARPVRACFELSPRARRKFYAGFCNRVLWPLLHGFPGRLSYEDDEWDAYVEANATYADLAARITDRDATIWVHDYHLLLAASALRQRGHRGPIGLFLHVPFPAVDVVETLPWAMTLLGAMTSFDVIGFHTSRWARNFLAAACGIVAADVRDDRIRHHGRDCHVGVFPIGIDPAGFDYRLEHARSPEVDGLVTSLGDRKLLLGVDRLDYSKGIPQRLEAFERLLETRVHWRRAVTFVQVSVPSRADVPDYVELRQRVENLVGRINGRFGEADWVPVRYLYRAYDHDVLAQLYRAADVAVVTPLRDGMNLVAKEFIAAQDPERPGVLVLSQFAGAADELRDAVLTNPYHRDGLAEDLDRALSMSPDERRERHRHLAAAVRAVTATDWASKFLDALGAQGAARR